MFHLPTSHISVTKLRKNLADTIRSTKRDASVAIILQDNEPEAVLMNYKDFESLVETVYVSADKETMETILQYENGKLIPEPFVIPLSYTQYAPDISAS